MHLGKPPTKASNLRLDPLNDYPWQIVCVKWGNRYGPQFVNRLYAMVSRNTSQPVRFICLTDDSTGIRPEVECLPLPELPCEHPMRTIGKWKKLVLWSRELHGITGPLLFVDLDSVIVGNMDGYFTHGDPHQVYLARNWARPTAKLGQTSVFRFFVGENPQILEEFCRDPQGVADKFHFEQHFVTATVKGGIQFWPEAWTRHFRLHCLPKMPFRYFVRPFLPSNARIITFPGGPDPGFVAEGRWDEKSPPNVGPLEHILRGFGPNRTTPSLWKHLKRYVRRSNWIAEHWRE